MNCVILQPSYVPWRGYFHQIAKADVFVFYDDIQYDQRGWRHRNRVKTSAGVQWLTIPVLARGSQTEHRLIRDIGVCWDRPWNHKHLTTLRHSYRRAPHFARYEPLLEAFYQQQPTLLSEFTAATTVALARELGFTRTRFVSSSALPIAPELSSTERLIAILQHLGCSHYISGPTARAYIDADLFERAGITLEYMRYDYPEYPQLHGPYDPAVSILDLLFMVGPDAARFIL